MASPTLFRSVDIGVFAAAMSDRLRTAGVDIGLSATERFSAALLCCPPTDIATLYWVARTCFASDRADLEIFDAVFGGLFQDESLAIVPGRQDPTRVEIRATGTVLRSSVPSDGLDIVSGRTARSTAPEVVDTDEAPSADDVDLPELLPSALAELADTPFDQLSREDLDLIGAWLEAAIRHFPMRRARRMRATHRRDRIDLLRTLKAARATAGEPMALAYRMPTPRRRRVVMLADVSGSMESFTRIYLHLMRSLVTRANAEVFTFATELERVTIALRERDPTAAMDRMTADVENRFSGTRIGASLRELLTSPIWSGSVRGAVVIIASDGWDADDPRELERQMARLHRLAYRVIWVNPRSAAPEFEPRVAGMAAALPHVDRVLSGHSLSSMRKVLAAIGE